MPERTAAAALSVSRAVAPAWRSLSKLSGMLVDPPVPCRPRIFITPPIMLREIVAIVPSSVDMNGTASSDMAVL